MEDKLSRQLSERDIINEEEDDGERGERKAEGKENGSVKQGERERIREWAIEIKEEVDQVAPNQGGCSIFEVPRSLQRLEPNAFLPQVVSIGPYHRGKPHLQEMEKHKRRLLQKLLDRTGRPLEDYVASMSKHEASTRQCYDKPVKHVKSKDFVRMMLFDSCFIFELLNAFHYGFQQIGYQPGDIIFTSRGISPLIQRDLLMLENQLPLFVIEELVDRNQDQFGSNDSLTDLVLNFFNLVIPGVRRKPHPHIRVGRLGKRLHLLDVVLFSLHSSLKVASSNQSKKLDRYKSRWQRAEVDSESGSNDSANSLLILKQPKIVMHSVTKLRGAGVAFVKNESANFMGIRFEKGVLYIPPLQINDCTKSVFLNLMAFEQFYPLHLNHVTSYLTFMDGLIDRSQDVEFLCAQGIIEHEFGSAEDVASLFNNLRKEIFFDSYDYYLSQVSHEVETYCSRKWHTWITTLKLEYLKDPWKIIQLVAATFLIFLTLAQTVYTMLGYHLPRN